MGLYMNQYQLAPVVCYQVVSGSASTCAELGMSHSETSHTSSLTIHNGLSFKCYLGTSHLQTFVVHTITMQCDVLHTYLSNTSTGPSPRYKSTSLQQKKQVTRIDKNNELLLKVARSLLDGWMDGCCIAEVRAANVFFPATPTSALPAWTFNK